MDASTLRSILREEIDSVLRERDLAGAHDHQKEQDPS